MMRWQIGGALVGLVVLGGGCAGSNVPQARYARTCLVLSVGGPNCIAHLGAIQAARDAQMRIDCVAGSSIGSRVGSLYATAPSESTPRALGA